MIGKIIISLVWVFWILAMSTVEGQDPSAVSQDDYDSLHAEVIELRKIKKIHQQMLPQGEKNHKMKDEYFPVQVLEEAGWPNIAIRGEKSYNGVAILSRLPSIFGA